jgi:hypothetical protein
LYNINLSKRRTHSLLNFLNEYKDGSFVGFIANNQFQVIVNPFGESKSADKVSSNPRDLKKSIYSIEAMLERKIEIIKISIE